jgi:excisionase family DNA binding protein
MAMKSGANEMNPRKLGRPAKQPHQIQDTANAKRPVACSMKASAAELGLCVPTLYKLLREGTLRSFCVGRRRLIPYEELLRFARDASKMPPSPVARHGGDAEIAGA